MCFMMILIVETPPDLAASTNSLPLMFSVWPLTILAMSSQLTAPIATKIKKILLPKKTINKITKNKKGIAYKTSTNLIINASTLPPIKPATAP